MTLQERRKKKGLTQKELAEMSGISKKTIQHYEAGFRDLDGAKLETISRLAIALGCHIPDILNSDDLKKLYNKAK